MAPLQKQIQADTDKYNEIDKFKLLLIIEMDKFEKVTAYPLLECSTSNRDVCVLWYLCVSQIIALNYHRKYITLFITYLSSKCEM